MLTQGVVAGGRSCSEEREQLEAQSVECDAVTTSRSGFSHHGGSSREKVGVLSVFPFTFVESPRSLVAYHLRERGLSLGVWGLCAYFR